MFQSRKERTPNPNGRKVKVAESAPRPYMKEICVRGFKSLRDVTMRPGRLNLLIGTNASGKSNFVEVLRVLNGLGRGLTIDEIFNEPSERPGQGPMVPVRGGTSQAVSKPKKTSKSGNGNGRIHLDVSFSGLPRGDYGYHVDMDVIRKQIGEENGTVAMQSIWNAEIKQEMRNGMKMTISESSLHTLHGLMAEHGFLDRSRLVGLAQALKNIPVKKKQDEKLQPLSTQEDYFDTIVDILGKIQILDPVPSIVKKYAKKRMTSLLGEFGENFSAVVSFILEENRPEFESWLRELTPREFDGVDVKPGASDDLLFVVKEKGGTYPADTLSDGTLRFAALAAALFQEPMPSVMAIEEIENGIHPTRLRLMVELLRAMSQESQVFATTHSPLVLAWLKPEEYKSTFIFKRNEEDGSTQVKALTDLPDFSKIIKKRSIIDLALEGWPEIAF
ncbi:MAG: AAA family ATPase [Deltaproteobacteria bacterium]|nr:AAA family ATPase [Deltaproteobacteria bacterium]